AGLACLNQFQVKRTSRCLNALYYRFRLVWLSQPLHSVPKPSISPVQELRFLFPFTQNGQLSTTRKPVTASITSLLVRAAVNSKSLQKPLILAPLTTP